jgi:hypothetical protein
MEGVMRLIHTVGLFGVSLWATGLMMIAGAEPALAENVCVSLMPSDVADVQGYTWVGTITRTGSTINFGVEHVYANHGAPGTSNMRKLESGSALDLPVEPCNDRLAGFAVGDRYLMTTSSLDTPTSDLSAAWRLVGERATFLLMHADKKFDTRLAAVKTLRDALALVAPDATLPPTSTSPSSVRSHQLADDNWVGIAVLLIGSLAGFAFRQRLRLTRSAVQGPGASAR